MTPNQIYQQLAQTGMTLRQAVEFTDRLIEQAPKRAGIFDNLTGMARDLGALTYPVMAAAVAAPPVLGYLGGDMLARGMDVDGSSVADIQEQELVAELAINAEAIRRRQRLREAEAMRR